MSGKPRGSSKRQPRNIAWVESLEGRRLMAVAIGKNLILNPDAESGAGSSGGGSVPVPGWSYANVDYKATVVPYGSTFFPAASDPGPGGRAANFFAGANTTADSELLQSLDLSAIAADIDAGRIGYTLNGWFGGTDAEDDTASLRAEFRSAAGDAIDNAEVGNVTADDRDDTTGLLFRTSNAVIPAGTRTVMFHLLFHPDISVAHVGYADSLVLKLTSSLGKTGQIAGVVRNDKNGDGNRQSGEGPISGATIFLDTNSNGKRDRGERAAVSGSDGKYQITGLAAGRYNVVTAPISGYRVSSTNPKQVSVAAGLTAVNDVFFSQTVVITGAAFNDSNSNGKKDSGESGAGMINVFLDFNDNGETESYELVSSSAANGTYRFIVPFGHYVVRVQENSGYHTTQPNKFYTVNLSRSKVARSLDFAVVVLDADPPVD